MIPPSAIQTLEIAGTRLGFSFNSPSFAGLVSKRYAPFLVKGGQDFRITVNAIGGKVSPFRPKISLGRGTLHLGRGDFNLQLNLAARRGALECAPREQAFDSFLRAFYSWLLPREGGLLLHAAGFSLKGAAHVFPGCSGAGKSTLSKLAEKRAELLSDELVPVRREAGGWYAYGSPFWGEMRRGGKNARCRLAGVYGLSKAKANGLEPAPAGFTLRLLLRCAMNFSREERDVSGLISAASRLAAEKGAGKLNFTKAGPGFVDLL